MTISVLLERSDDLLEKLYQRVPDPNPKLLFDSTELQAYSKQSPIWLPPSSSSIILESMHQAPTEWPGLIIESHATEDVLLGHLRHILFVHFENERRGVLRYSSPTTASYFFTINDENTSSLWMGPISRLRWFGGTWFDLAHNKLRWFNTQAEYAQHWTKPDERKTFHLSSLHERALHRQQKEHFLYLWWQRQSDLSLTDASSFLDEGMQYGFVEPDDLNNYLSLRASYPNDRLPVISLDGSAEERLARIRQHLTSHLKDKELRT
uniref:DUF4123 domain-containing protein n=1 Tax=Pseudomonas sp. EA_5y_Pfl2_R50 TaxID=3088691 RepID=UPI0030DB18C8